jgi:hypothetical protein
MEELGLTVTPRGLMYVREYVGKNHAMHRIHGHFHQVEAVFHCDCADFGPIGEGRERDRRQVGFEWLPSPNSAISRFLRPDWARSSADSWLPAGRPTWGMCIEGLPAAEPPALFTIPFSGV